MGHNFFLSSQSRAERQASEAQVIKPTLTLNIVYCHQLEAVNQHGKNYPLF